MSIYNLTTHSPALSYRSPLTSEPASLDASSVFACPSPPGCCGAQWSSRHFHRSFRRGRSLPSPDPARGGGRAFSLSVFPSPAAALLCLALRRRGTGTQQSGRLKHLHYQDPSRDVPGTARNNGSAPFFVIRDALKSLIEWCQQFNVPLSPAVGLLHRKSQKLTLALP